MVALLGTNFLSVFCMGLEKAVVRKKQLVITSPQIFSCFGYLRFILVLQFKNNIIWRLFLIDFYGIAVFITKYYRPFILFQ